LALLTERELADSVFWRLADWLAVVLVDGLDSWRLLSISYGQNAIAVITIRAVYCG
jgi:hypothetical protein